MKTKQKPSVITYSQVKKVSKNIIYDGKECFMTVKIRYDDECKNGHNTFAITGDILRGKTFLAGGCIHNEIKKYFPEFSHLIKWHLTSSEPMHYIANTIYWAKDREYINKAIGEPVKFEKALKFKDIPLIFNFKESFYNFISSVKNWDEVEIIALEHKKDSNIDFKPKYTFKGTQSIEWYQGEFDTLQKANEWLEMFKKFEFEIIETPIKWNEAKTPNLEAARNCAVWEDATLEQLQSEEALKKRLPKLMKQFRKDVEALGFIF